MTGDITQSGLIDLIDEQRSKLGYLSMSALMALSRTGNVILDPFSTLISIHAEIGHDNILHPAVRLDATLPATLEIGSRNMFYGNTMIDAQTGPITIGNGNLFGEGCVHVATSQPGAAITIGSDGRYRGSIQISGLSVLGDGSQILGSIIVRDVQLGAGGSFRHPNADERGAVLKGVGQGSGIILQTGQVIAGNGTLARENVRMQSFYHPDAK
ncbi:MULTISPECIES: hypothetical protein [Thalassospira]|jgi:hypothetical protein|uniref:hypothetical protein n=1 Tax=Thalassospira TaxID=168934 RepID=UPI00080FC7AA|nr:MULTISPECIES: hypothetical protein [Thalassospira]MAB31518.1 hypothetical protein [Thalassospira sp.]MDM7974567.1 hypothetical protein [Thalassospira xiamenensis]OCK06150.1 hypothetical protein KO164_0327 [Thalassospira sp. KO164]OHZ02120.1 hypothetical protein BC440_14265 [Thalassospira sp. MIT1004]QPL34964.1 hypothetical protein IT971_17840 [Thalassospira sp. B30-1]|tara:strand:- start:112 stop:750 length:639 start_codon:yes stop_codon:yes gene_type:complete